MKPGELYRKAIDKWGLMQVCQAQEEAGEFIRACTRKLNGRGDNGEFNFEEEIADLEIMLAQMKLICDIDKYKMWKCYKLNRLKEKLRKDSRGK